MRAWLVAFIAGVLVSLSAPAQAEKRVALVVGNGTYRHVPPLLNPTNDASDIAASLERLGFSVRRVSNGSYDDMRRALLDFSQQTRDADMAVVFFAGHGMEIGGENWLIPIDARLQSDVDAEQEAVGLRSVLNIVARAGKLGLVILDACRNNPFAAKMARTIRTRAVERGLVRIEPSDNVLVAYAAKDGTTAADGTGRNSPFTASLLKHLETPGLEVRFLLANVRDDVIAATRREQQPFMYGSLSKEHIFFKAGTPPAQAGVPAGPTPDETAWSFIKDTKDPDQLRRFIEQFPASARRAEAAARLAALEQAKPAVVAPTVVPPPVQTVVAPPAKSAVPTAVRPGVLIREFVGHSDPVSRVAVSPDGRRILSGGHQGRVRLWDAASGALIREFTAAPGVLRAAAFSPDGQRILTASQDTEKSLRLWDAASGRLIWEAKGDSSSLGAASVAFSPDGGRIVSGSWDNSVRLWDAATGKVLWESKGHSDLVYAVAFSPDGRRVLSGSYDRTLRLWDAVGTLIREFKGHSGEVYSVAFSPDGRRVVSGSQDKSVRLWDATSGALIREFTGHSDLVLSVAFSPDGRRILSGSRDKSLRLWDVDSGVLIREFKGHSGQVNSVAFSPDGQRIVSASEDKSLRLWDAASGDRSPGEATATPR